MSKTYKKKSNNASTRKNVKSSSSMRKFKKEIVSVPGY